jgi:hypothetical protein
LEGVENAAAHGAAADHSEIDLFHRGENGEQKPSTTARQCLFAKSQRLVWAGGWL